MTDQERVLRAFYDEVMMPFAARSQHSGAAGKDAGTFYITRAPADHIRAESDVPLAQQLRQLWETTDPDLVDLARRLDELQALFDAPTNEARDVSPFLYAMF